MTAPQPPPGAWRTLSQRCLFHSPVFDLHLRRMCSPRHDQPGDFYVFTCPDWVNVIALTETRELVMIRQFRVGSGQLEWEIPGGLIDPADADPVAAAARELREETGYEGTDGKIIGCVNPNPALQGNQCHTVCFRNARLCHAPQPDPFEDIATVTVPLPEVWRMLDDGLIRHAMVVAAILFLLRHERDC